MKTKICKKCKEDKTLDNFWKKEESKDGYYYQCKCCLRKNNIIGIYKIISPSNKIYIGQSTRIIKRWRKEYKGLYKGLKNQTKLFNSLKKYGPENHVFEIICECDLDELDQLEILYKKFYLNKLGSWDKVLFHKLNDGKGGFLSEETKNKISKALKGRPNTWNKDGCRGYKYTEEQKAKMRKPRVNKWIRDNMLSPDIVKEIRDKFETGNYTKSKLSREYNVSWGTIKNVIDKINSYQD